MLAFARLSTYNKDVLQVCHCLCAHQLMIHAVVSQRHSISARCDDVHTLIQLPFALIKVNSYNKYCEASFSIGFKALLQEAHIDACT